MLPALKMLREIVQYGLHGVDREHIIFIAKSVWYYDLLPNLGEMDGPFRNDAGYLLNSLARFNVLSKERRQDLNAAIEPFKPLSPSVDQDLHDPLAREWHSSCDIMPFLGDILPFQTRHYASGFGW